MKSFNTLLFFILSLLCLSYAAPAKSNSKEPERIPQRDKDNFNMANTVANGEATLEDNQYYVFMEKWKARNPVQQCAAGTSHYRLVVGLYQGEAQQTFDARAWDMVMAPDHTKSEGVYGASWTANHDPFWANHYMTVNDPTKENKPEFWKKASRENDYEFLGKLKPGIVRDSQRRRPQDGLAKINEYLKKQGKHIEANGQPYNAAGIVIGNNCITYARALANTVTEDDKEKCE